MRCLLVASEASRVYNVPEPTLRRWVSEGRMVRYGTSSRAFYDANEVEQLCVLLARPA